MMQPTTVNQTMDNAEKANIEHNITSENVENETSTSSQQPLCMKIR